MIERFSTVVLTEDLPDEGLVAGDSGTVIDVYDGGAGYEIEFFALSGDTIAVATVESKMVRSTNKADVTHSSQSVQKPPASKQLYFVPTVGPIKCAVIAERRNHSGMDAGGEDPDYEAELDPG